MVTGLPSRQISLIADQIARVEAHRGRPAVYVGLLAPRTVDVAALIAFVRERLEERGSHAEISVTPADVDRITLQTLEFSLEA